MFKTGEYKDGCLKEPRVTESYERWLQQGFGQVAYLARDILTYGTVQSETNQRVINEFAGLALEKLGKPYTTSFEYTNTARGLAAEDGELLQDIFARGAEVARRDALIDSRLNFRDRRHEADMQHIAYLDALVRNPEKPVGTCVIIASPCPNYRELGIPEELISDFFYQPELDMSMVWVATKTHTGLNLQTINLFHASPDLLQQTLAYTLRRPIGLVLSREDMVHVRHETVNESGYNIADELRETFDYLSSGLRNETTFHGLSMNEHGEQNISSQELIYSEEFTQARQEALHLLTEVAHSLVDKQLYVPAEYLGAMLALKKSDGTYELEGERRSAVFRVLNGTTNEEQVQLALQSVYQTVSAGLWAKLRSLYDGETATDNSYKNYVGADGINHLQHHRAVGSAEYDCPGGGTANPQQSIYDMSADALASLFMVQKFITNCPLCNETGVEATKANGTITCSECSGSVEVCTGEVIRKANKKKKVKKVAKKPVNIYQMLGFDGGFKKKLEIQQNMRR